MNVPGSGTTTLLPVDREMESLDPEQLVALSFTSLQIFAFRSWPLIKLTEMEIGLLLSVKLPRTSEFPARQRGTILRQVGPLPIRTPRRVPGKKGRASAALP